MLTGRHVYQEGLFVDHDRCIDDNEFTAKLNQCIWLWLLVKRPSEGATSRQACIKRRMMKMMKHCTRWNNRQLILRETRCKLCELKRWMKRNMPVKDRRGITNARYLLYSSLQTSDNQISLMTPTKETNKRKQQTWRIREQLGCLDGL